MYIYICSQGLIIRAFQYNDKYNILLFTESRDPINNLTLDLNSVTNTYNIIFAGKEKRVSIFDRIQIPTSIESTGSVTINGTLILKCLNNNGNRIVIINDTIRKEIFRDFNIIACSRKLTDDEIINIISSLPMIVVDPKPEQCKKDSKQDKKESSSKPAGSTSAGIIIGVIILIIFFIIVVVIFSRNNSK